MIGWLKLSDSQRKVTIDQVVSYLYVFSYFAIRETRKYIYLHYEKAQWYATARCSYSIENNI